MHFEQRTGRFAELLAHPVVLHDPARHRGEDRHVHHADDRVFAGGIDVCRGGLHQLPLLGGVTGFRGAHPGAEVIRGLRHGAHIHVRPAHEIALEHHERVGWIALVSSARQRLEDQLRASRLVLNHRTARQDNHHGGPRCQRQTREPPHKDARPEQVPSLLHNVPHHKRPTRGRQTFSLKRAVEPTQRRSAAEPQGFRLLGIFPFTFHASLVALMIELTFDATSPVKYFPYATGLESFPYFTGRGQRERT